MGLYYEKKGFASIMYFDVDLKRIQEKITEVSGCKLKVPVSMEVVKSVEDKYNFTLPEQYRAFITCLGNGGTLPSESGESVELLSFADQKKYSTLSRPFPFEDSYEWSDDTDYSTNDPADIERYEHAYKNGHIVLVENPNEDGFSWILVVTGTRSGEVWLRDSDGFLRLPNCSFLDWFELYLDKKLKSLTERISNELHQKKAAYKKDHPIETIKLLISAKRNEHIQWNAPISEHEVKRFERAHGLILPEEYKMFITEVADGCINFTTPNSHGKGGKFFSLKDFEGIANLNKPFCFTENSDELRRLLTNTWGPYGIKNPIWSSKFKDIPRESPLNSVWALPDYSVLCGVLPFAIYNDTNMFNTQACLILNGPLKGQVWLARKGMLKPGTDESNFYTWIIEMLKDGAR